MRILIAEDDTALAGFVRQGLQGEHYAVDVVEDGEQARAMGSEFDYDLVILDLNLPKLDGVSVLRHLRLKRPSLPVLVLTQRVKVEDRVQCLDTGADDYLPKPFSYSELSARIRALLRRSHLPSESVLVVEDLQARSRRTPRRTRRPPHRTHIQRVFPAGISDAQCRPSGLARNDHRTRLEPDLLILQPMWWMFISTICPSATASCASKGTPTISRFILPRWSPIGNSQRPGLPNWFGF
jgi:CheY-like chemotaxis protein